ncbi:hypothetical protein [Aeromicrobium sp.]|uniref:hypothetical protein n=1 Tax=Aeromicrobium sp. TaxID=1871063 RepID=UPI002FC9ED34
MSLDLGSVTGKPSIYEFIRGHLDEVGRLVEPAASLPDEATVMSGDLKWAPGAMDGAFGHHGGGAGSAQLADSAAQAFVAASKRPTRRRLSRLYKAVQSDNVLDFMDPLIEKLVQLQPDRGRLHDLGRWLATTASDRGAVKVGIAILGVTGLDRDVDVVRALGAHDEFTLFAAVALSNGLEDSESELWALANVVDGWGRIQCVERLRDTTDPAIRRWILREGFRNSVMYEYLAHIAATTGGLLEALRAEEPDRDLLTAAGEILAALIDGGPAEDMTDYDDGADATEAFLAHMARRAETLHDFQAVAAIRSFLDSESVWDDLGARGWSATRRDAFERLCDEVLARQEWIERIQAGLESPDAVEYWRAEQAARRRGIDVFHIQVRRIRQDPFGQDWFAAWQGATPERAEELVNLATELLPLGDMGTGPQDLAGFGPEWRSHNALDWTLQALRSHPGVGAHLVLIGLQSPMTRNRNMSLNALSDWPREQWPPGAEELVQRLATADPNEHAREHAGEVLAGTVLGN